MKKEDKITARELNEMEISTVSNRELKVMVIKILTGLKERVVDLNETLNKEIENTQKNQQR